MSDGESSIILCDFDVETGTVDQLLDLCQDSGIAGNTNSTLQKNLEDLIKGRKLNIIAARRMEDSSLQGFLLSYSHYST